MSHADELKMLADDVLELLGTGTDADGVGEAVTVRLTTRTENDTTGVPSVTNKDLPVSAVIGPVRTGSMGGDDRGVVEYREFTVGAAELTAAMNTAGVTPRRLQEGDQVVVAAGARSTAAGMPPASRPPCSKPPTARSARAWWAT